MTQSNPDGSRSISLSMRVSRGIGGGPQSLSQRHGNCRGYEKVFKHRFNSQPIRSRIMSSDCNPRSGKIKYGILAWLIGLPLPIVIILLFVKGCDF
jgi:hypothetical protein